MSYHITANKPLGVIIHTEDGNFHEARLQPVCSSRTQEDFKRHFQEAMEHERFSLAYHDIINEVEIGMAVECVNQLTTQARDAAPDPTDLKISDLVTLVSANEALFLADLLEDGPSSTGYGKYSIITNSSINDNQMQFRAFCIPTTRPMDLEESELSKALCTELNVKLREICEHKATEWRENVTSEILGTRSQFCCQVANGTLLVEVLRLVQSQDSTEYGKIAIRPVDSEMCDNIGIRAGVSGGEASSAGP